MIRHGVGKGFWLVPCVLLSACALFQGRPRPVHASAEEAMKVQFPDELPVPGRHVLPGAVAAAIQLAAEDFRPLGTRPKPGATPLEACLLRRDAFDVVAAPGPGGMVFVRFSFNPEVCALNVPVLDAGATYAVDVQTSRILAVE
jgi:hypothetical protein